VLRLERGGSTLGALRSDGESLVPERKLVGLQIVDWTAVTTLLVVALLLVVVSAVVWAQLLATMQRATFWEFQIRAFEKADKVYPPELGAVLFTGSSSIRYWSTLSRDLAPLRVLNRGFGGCHLAHVTHYAGRIILPYRPRAIVLYAGENDLGWPSNKKPETVLEDFKRLASLVQAKLPGVGVYFISIKLSRFRRGRWDAIRTANRLVKEFACGRDDISFIDTATAMLDAKGHPSPRYQPWYRLHMNTEGYTLWASIVRPVLQAHLG
jgi:lysophospholipase L1-like esterase